MGKNKPRKATHRRVNKKLHESIFRSGGKCEWWDGGYPECMLPWSDASEKGCGGDPFKCRKIYYKYLAGSKKPSQFIINCFIRTENRNTI